MESTALWARLTGQRKNFTLYRPRTRNWLLLWLAGMQNLPARLGVCIATSGPGAIHLLNGLYDAKLDHQPVVAIVGQQSTLSLGGNYQQEVDLLSLFKDVAGEYIQMMTDPAQARQLIDRALRIAKAQRTVTCIIIPNNIQEMVTKVVNYTLNFRIMEQVGYCCFYPVPGTVFMQ
jgi:pyruvate dehydrogenase (quinone)